VKLQDAAFDALGHVDVLVNSPGAVARSSVTEVTDEGGTACSTSSSTARSPRSRCSPSGWNRAPSSTSPRCRPEWPSRISPRTRRRRGHRRLHARRGGGFGPEIRVNAIRPGFVVTEQTADTYVEGDPRYETIKSRTTQSRLAKPEEITGAAVYFASDAASLRYRRDPHRRRRLRRRDVRRVTRPANAL